MEPLTREILDFWFGEPDDQGMPPADKVERWFKKNAEFDDEIRRRFASYLETARMGALDRWTEGDAGSVALIVLLDQFPRNIYRGDSRSFLYDKKALSLTRLLIDSGRLTGMPGIHAYFCLMPAMHAEDEAVQNEGITLFDEAAARAESPAVEQMLRAAHGYAVQHRDIIARFGRFPHRNSILGRPSTPEEEAFLQTPGSSF